MRIVSVATLSAAAVAILAPAASAQFHQRYPAYEARPYSAYEVAPSPAFYCVKDCMQDTKPCDPPVYKRADGRCVSPGAGGIR